jgi:succinate dehydrogenase / fumarate reductase flavoprotein subunit
MAKDALRKESCGGPWDHQLQKVKQKEMTKNKYVAAWEYKGDDINAEVLHKEELVYENIEVKTRSYK